MSKKSARIAALLDGFRGQDLDAHYLAYLDCFDRQFYFEAHEVLEELWLTQRRGANGQFYTGLIQMAGAFVHLQKGRPRPAAALLKLVRANLQVYPPSHEHLHVTAVLQLIEGWLVSLESGRLTVDPRTVVRVPRLPRT